jgi:hypothetical protein
MLAEATPVGLATLKPPPVASGVGVIVTSPTCAKWSPFASFQGYSAQPALALGLAQPTVPVSSWVT